MAKQIAAADRYPGLLPVSIAVNAAIMGCGIASWYVDRSNLAATTASVGFVMLAGLVTKAVYQSVSLHHARLDRQTELLEKKIKLYAAFMQAVNRVLTLYRAKMIPQDQAESLLSQIYSDVGLTKRVKLNEIKRSK